MMRKPILIVAFFIVLYQIIPCSDHAKQDDDLNSLSEENILRVGYTAQAFSKGFVEDVRAALEMWGDKLTQKYDKTRKIKVDIYENHEEMQKKMLRGEIDLLVVSSVEYLNLELCSFMEPTTAESTGGSVGQEFILLIRKDTNFDSLQKLKGREIIIHKRAVGMIPEMWLDVILGREGVMDRERFFKKINIVEKASKTVLPVYFKQADACIVTARTFDTICELNPQLKKDLDVILRSPPYLRGLSLINTNMDPDMREDTLDALFTMEEEPEGRQIHIILQIEDIVPFKPEYLDSVRILQKEHHKLNPASTAVDGQNGENR